MKRLTWCAGWMLFGASLALAAAPAVNAPPANSNEDFVKTASEAGLMEVNFAELALRQADKADVKAFAQMMVDDHTKINGELLKLANKDQFTPAAKMNAKDQEEFSKLSKMKGADFDRAYVHNQLEAHEGAVALFKSEAKDGKNADLKAFAEKTLPTLEHHLDMVQKLTGEEKGKTTEKPK